MLWLTFPFATTCQASFKLIHTSQILIHNTYSRIHRRRHQDVTSWTRATPIPIRNAYSRITVTADACKNRMSKSDGWYTNLYRATISAPIKDRAPRLYPSRPRRRSAAGRDFLPSASLGQTRKYSVRPAGNAQPCGDRMHSFRFFQWNAGKGDQWDLNPQPHEPQSCALPIELWSPRSDSTTGGQGFEPRLAVPKTAVLPLDDPPSRSAEAQT